MPDDANARKFVTKNESVILKAIAGVTQGRIAKAMGHDHASYVSTFLSGKTNISFDEMIAMLDEAGLAVHRVTEESVIVPVKEWKDTMCYAKRYWTERTCDV